MRLFKTHAKRLVAFLLVLLIFTGALPFSVSAAETTTDTVSDSATDNTSDTVNGAENAQKVDYKTELNGWKVKSTWSTLSDTYEWNAETASSRQVKMMVTYRLNTSQKVYPPESLVITVPGIGNSNRASVKEATDVAGGNDDSEWSYSYNAETDTYTFKNKYEIQEGQSTSGGFEIIWTVNARDTVTGYEQSKSVTFSDGNGKITLPPLTFKFTSKRDEEVVKLDKEPLTGKEFETSDKNFVWYKIHNKFTEKTYARGLYKSRYYVTLDTPDGTSADDVIIMKENTNHQLEKISFEDLGNNKLGFYLFNDRYGSLNSTESYLIGLKKVNYEGKIIGISGHLDCLFNDEENWTLTPSEGEVYDVHDNLTVVSYNFPKVNGFIKANKSTGTPTTNYKELFDGFTGTFYLTGSVKVDYGSPAFSAVAASAGKSSAKASTKKALSESVGAKSIDIGSKVDGDMVLGDNKLSIVLKNGDIRELTDDEYHFSGVELPAFESKKYELYVANTQDEVFENYRLYASGNLERNIAISFPDASVKAFYVKVYDIKSDCQYRPKVNVRFHFNSKEEQQKETNAQIDAEKYITNYMFLRYFVQENGKEIDAAAIDDYEGTFAQYIKSIDQNVFGSDVYRDSSELHLRTPITYVDSYTSISEFDNSSKYGFKSSINSSGYISADEDGTLKKFSMVTAFPSQLKIDLDKADIKVSGSAGAPGTISDYLSFAKYEKNGKTFIVANFDYSASPLNIKNQTSVSINYPVELSYFDYQEYGALYTANTFVLIQDDGAELLKYNQNNITYDVNDYDNDGIIDEKGAMSNHNRTVVEKAREWREFTSKEVKSYYNKDFSKEAVTRLYNQSKPEKRNLSTYTYRLEFGVGADNAKNIVFYDDLENGASISENNTINTIPSEWKGVFSDVDTSYAQNSGMIPTVYYTTVSNAVKDISANVWSTSAPQDLSQVKGIAVHLDTSKLDSGVLRSGQAVYMDVNMLAPSDENFVGKKAVNQFYVSYDAYGVDDDFEQSYELPSAETYVELFKNVGQKTLRKVDLDAPITNADGSVSYPRVAGAKIMVYDSNKEPVFDSPITMTLGDYTFKNVECGTYYWEEVEAPNGYAKLDGLHQFTVTDYDNTIALIGNKRIPGVLSFYKCDADNGDEYIAGAVYELYTSNGDLVYTDSNNVYSKESTAIKSQFVTEGMRTPVMITNLPWGSYYLQEKTAPKGYLLSDEKIEFTVSKDKIVHVIRAENNEIKSSARLIKKDAKTEKPLKDARFRLEKHEDGNWTALSDGNILKTNTVGEIIVENLTFGRYRWNEFVAPVGYEKCEPAEFIINADNAGTLTSVEIKEPRKQGTAKLRKKSTDGTVLKGAVYSLYTSDNVLVKDGLFTDEYGETAVVSGLEWGDYYFKEDKAPTGYRISDKKLSFTIDARTAEFTQVVEGEDEKQLGSAKLIKTNKFTDEADKVLLEGAVFNLYKSDGTLVKENLITDANGEINVSNLDWNSYYFSEMKAPDGYSINPDKIRFSINASNAAKTQEVTCQDEQGLCEIKVDKEINEQYAPFGNATFIFEVFGVDNEGKEHRYTKSITISNGQTEGSAVFSRIPVGKYQVHEKDVARYVKSQIHPMTDNVSVASATLDGKTQSIANVDLTVNDFGEVKFINRITQYEKLNHNNSVANVLNKARKLIGITVDYVGANPISSKSSSAYTFKASDIVITAYYDNDTTAKIAFSDVVLSPSTVTAYENASGVGYTVDVSYTENGIMANDSFNVLLDLKPLPKRNRALFDATEGYFLHNNSSLLDVSYYHYGDVSNCVISGVYEEPQNDTKMFLGWYTTPDYQDGTQVKVLATDLENPEDNVIVFTDSDSNPIQLSENTTLYAKWSEAGTLEKSGSCGANATYKLYDNGLLIIEGTGEIRNSENQNEPILMSSNDREKVKKIIISDDITSIADYALSSFTYNKSITIPNSVISIGESAFSGMNGLTDLVLPKNLTTIGNYAFERIKNLKNLVVQNKNIDDFQHDAKLENAIIPASSTRIRQTQNGNVIFIRGDSSINAGTNLVFCEEAKTVTIHEGLTSIGYLEYSGKKELTSVVIPGSVNTISTGAFSNCLKLTTVQMDEGVTTIQKEAFSGCTGLTNINIPDSVTTIGESAFSGCTGLTNINIPDSVNTIEGNVFYGCTGLTNVTIPDGVITIGYGAFSGCTGLTNITIPDSVTTIGSGAFSGCTGLTNITIPDSVNTIGNSAFSGCTGLTNITIPDGVTKIEASAFSGCTVLTNVTIPDGVTTIGNGAFSGCTGLTSIAIPDSVTSIGAQAFGRCTGLTSIVIPSGITNVNAIQKNAFAGCMNCEIDCSKSRAAERYCSQIMRYPKVRNQVYKVNR